MILTPKNWHEFQHYKWRRPPWIRLHRKLLDNFEFSCLQDASRALAPCLWLLASEYENGTINASVAEIAFRFRISEKTLLDALGPLIDKGFFICEHDASNVLAARKQNSTTETETELEKERSHRKIRQKKGNLYPDDFMDWWNAYPKTPVMSKQEAGRVWQKLSEQDRLAAMAALLAYKAFLASKLDHPAVHACRFLSQRRFDGFATQPQPTNGGWRPGLPTDAELRAKYANEGLGDNDSDPASVVENGIGSRPH